MAAVSKVPCVGFGYLVLTALLEARRGAGFSKRPCFRCVCSRAWRVWEQAQQINQGLEAAAVGTFPPHLRNIRYNNWPTYTCIATGDEDWVTRWRDIEIHSRWGVFFCLLRYCRYHEIFFLQHFYVVYLLLLPQMILPVSAAASGLLLLITKTNKVQ